MKTLLILTLSSIGMLTDTPEIMAGCLILVIIILGIKTKQLKN